MDIKHSKMNKKTFWINANPLNNLRTQNFENEQNFLEPKVILQRFMNQERNTCEM